MAAKKTAESNAAAEEQAPEESTEEQGASAQEERYSEENAVDGVPKLADGPDEEELEARRLNVLGAGTGFTAGPSQADLNPAYSQAAFEDKDSDNKAE